MTTILAFWRGVGAASRIVSAWDSRECERSAPLVTTDKICVLFVHTATLAPLGADTWVHGQIMRDLDRSTHELHAAQAIERREAPTPTFEFLSTIPDILLHPVDFGPELFGRSLTGKLRALYGTLRAVPSLAGL